MTTPAEEIRPGPRYLLTHPRALFALLRDTVKAWQADKASRLAAALAYYTLFSMAPLLILGVTILGQVMGRDQASEGIRVQIERLAGPAAASAVETIAGVEDGSPDGNIWITVISTVTLLLGASGVFGQLQDALNTIWGITLRPEGGLMALIRKRFLAFSMILVIGFLLIISLLLSAVLTFFSSRLGERIPELVVLFPFLDFAVSVLVITVLFALIYNILPSVKIAWSDVWIGAAITSLLFTIGKLLIGLYLGRSNVGSAFGAAGSLIVILVWIYYSAQIFLLGAEFTYVYANQYGSCILPSRYAIYFESGAVAQTAPQLAQLPAVQPAVRQPWYKSYGLILFGFLLGLLAGAARAINSDLQDEE
jgi:membrane protein